MSACAKYACFLIGFVSVMLLPGGEARAEAVGLSIRIPGQLSKLEAVKWPNWGKRHPSLIQDVERLQKAYPGHIVAVELDEDGSIFFKTGSNVRVLYDDRIARNLPDMLKEGDLEDSLRQVYKAGPVSRSIPPSSDPGRVRSDEWLKSLYGTSPSFVP